MATFDIWDFETAQKAMNTATVDAGKRANLLFYEGDHWQDGAAWLGTQANPTEPAAVQYNAQIEEQIQRMLVSKNIIAELADRHSAGVLGREFSRVITPKETPAETDGTEPPEPPADAGTGLAEELEAMLDEWLDKDDIDEAIRSAATDLLLVGRSDLRFLIPPGRLDDEGRLTVETPEEALDNVFLMAPIPGAATVYRDPETYDRCGLFSYTADEQEQIELTYLDEAGNTVIRTVSREGPVSEMAIVLGQNRTLYELTQPALITPQIRQLQKLYNLAATMMGRNTELGGFRERIAINADLRGETVDGRFIPEPLIVGPGAFVSLKGLPMEDLEGNETFATPAMQYADPIPVDTFIATQDAAYRAALEEGHQLHYLIAGDATPSGRSREQAMADHLAALALTKRVVDRALTWVLQTSTAYAEALINQPGRWSDSLEIRAVTRLYAGPVSSETITTIANLYRDELLSAETALELIGIENVRQELERIAAQRETSQAPLQQLGEIEGTLTDLLRQRQEEPPNGAGGQPEPVA